MPDPLILLGAASAGLVQGVSGFALALVASVFWSGVVPPAMFGPLIALTSTAGQLLSIRTVLPALDLRRAAPMVAGGLAGVPFGVAMIPGIDAASFRLGVGLLLCVYCPAMLLLRRLPRLTWGGRAGDAAAGFVGGVMGGLAGLAGPGPILWCALRGWDRDTQRAMFQTFLIATQAGSVLAYAATGLITAEVLRIEAWVLPCALLPSLLGTMLYARLGGEAFRRLVLAILGLTGVALVVQSTMGR